VDGTRGGAPDAPELLVVQSHRVRLEERVLLLELLLVDARDVFLLPLRRAPRVVLPRGRRGHERDVAVERVALQTRERVVLRRVVQRLGGALTARHETPQLDERASCGEGGEGGEEGRGGRSQTFAEGGAPKSRVVGIAPSAWALTYGALERHLTERLAGARHRAGREARSSPSGEGARGRLRNVLRPDSWRRASTAGSRFLSPFAAFAPDRPSCTTVVLSADDKKTRLRCHFQICHVDGDPKSRRARLSAHQSPCVALLGAPLGDARVGLPPLRRPRRDRRYSRCRTSNAATRVRAPRHARIPGSPGRPEVARR